jgi:hypothetical protein
MKRLTLALAVATAMIAVAPATATVPTGPGLVLLEQFIPLVCTGGGLEQTTFAVYVTRGGGATGWRVDQNQHHVLSYFSITTHLPTGDVTEAKTWGVKQGIAAMQCAQEIPELTDPRTGMTYPPVSIRGTIHPLPGGGN